MNSFQFEPFKLSCSKKVAFFCMDQSCNSSSPFCNDQSCDQCNLKHRQRCGMNTPFSYIIAGLIKKKKNIEELEREVDDLTEQIIKQITIWSNQIKKTVKKQVLTQNQMLFQNYLSNKQINKMTPKFMINLQSTIKQQDREKLSTIKTILSKQFKGLSEQISKLSRIVKTNVAAPIIKSSLRSIVSVQSSPQIQYEEIELPVGRFLKEQKHNTNHVKKHNYDNPSLNSTVGFVSVQDFLFDPSINSDSFKISDNGKGIVALKNNDFHFAAVSPGSSFQSPFQIVFHIKKLRNDHSMYVGFCDLKKVQFCNYICYLDQSSHSFLINQNGQVYNFLSSEPHQRSQFCFREGDSIELNFIPWLGIMFRNKTKGNKSVYYQVQKKGIYNICFALGYSGNQIKITSN